MSITLVNNYLNLLINTEYLNLTVYIKNPSYHTNHYITVIKITFPILHCGPYIKYGQIAFFKKKFVKSLIIENCTEYSRFKQKQNIKNTQHSKRCNFLNFFLKNTNSRITYRDIVPERKLFKFSQK